MMGFAMLLVAAALAFGLSQALRLPLIPLLLLGGVLLRHSGLALPEAMAQSSLELGLAMLVFSAGMELNPKRFGGKYRQVLGVGLSQFVVVGVGGGLLVAALGFDAMSALYTGLAITTTSTFIVVRLLKTRQQMFEPFGRIVTGVLLIQDLVVVLLIVVLYRLPEGAESVLRGSGAMLVLIALAYCGLRWVMPYLVLRLKLDQETLGLTIMAVLFAFMGLAYLLGLPMITGAFLAGVSLSAFPVNSVARGMVTSLTTLFLALFFTVLGSAIEVGSGRDWLIALALSAFIILVTPLVVTLVAERLGLTARASIESGLLLAQTSEFSLVVVLQGLIANQILPQVFNVVALTTVITMTVTPLLATDRLTWRLMRLRAGRRECVRRDLRGHVILLGYGRGGSMVVKALREAGREPLVVDDDPIVVRDLTEKGIAAMRGDGSDRRVLEEVNARDALAIVSSMRRVGDTEAVIRAVGANGPKVIARVSEPDDADRIRSLGGIPVLASTSAAEAFIQWYDYTIR